METTVTKIVNEALEAYKTSVLFLCFVSVVLEASLHGTSKNRSNVQGL